MDVGFKPFFVLFKWVMGRHEQGQGERGVAGFHRRCLKSLCKKPVLSGGESKERGEM